jgi:choline-sulfatase
MEPANLLFILSDQHRRSASGCYGHGLVRTPNLDRLAARGTRFTQAYTPCPICVPARASLATGREVNEIGSWDNAFPYDGSVPSWGHRLKSQGFRVDSVGKLHFRAPGEDHGFTEEHDAMYVVAGVGDLLGCIRDNPPPRRKLAEVRAAGPGQSTYLEYDARIARRAVEWMKEHAADERPWVLFVSFVCPHPPYIAPQRLFDLYPPEAVDLPIQWRPEEQPPHPALAWMREKFGLPEIDEPSLRKAIAAYYGACTYLDERVGELMDALDATGLAGRTRVLYTSDHGEALGSRGLFGKFTMYEEAAAIPMIAAGPGVPEGGACDTPVSLVDCFPTIMEGAGAAPEAGDLDLPGRSLWRLAVGETHPDREIISEYHAVNSRSAIFMLRRGRYKYVHYVHGPPQLFDLITDPDELTDLAPDPGYSDLLRHVEVRLRVRLDPEEVDARAKSDQHALIERFGGVEAVLKRGTFDNSPIPGEPPRFH